MLLLKSFSITTSVTSNVLLLKWFSLMCEMKVLNGLFNVWWDLLLTCLLSVVIVGTIGTIEKFKPLRITSVSLVCHALQLALQMISTFCQGMVLSRFFFSKIFTWYSG